MGERAARGLRLAPVSTSWSTSALPQPECPGSTIAVAAVEYGLWFCLLSVRSPWFHSPMQKLRRCRAPQKPLKQWRDKLDERGHRHHGPASSQAAPAVTAPQRFRLGKRVDMGANGGGAISGLRVWLPGIGVAGMAGFRRQVAAWFGNPSGAYEISTICRV